MMVRRSPAPGAGDPIYQNFYLETWWWQDDTGDLIGPYGSRGVAEHHYFSYLDYMRRRTLEYPV